MEVPQELQDLIYEVECWANESWADVPEDCYGIESNNILRYRAVHLKHIDI